MERVIVTGATSMIGEALIEECLKHGISVCAVIRKDTARKDRLPQDPHLELVECSLEELAALPEKVTGSFDTFYHIAGGIPVRQEIKVPGYRVRTLIIPWMR